MRDLSRDDFERLIFEIDLKTCGEVVLRATETAVFADSVQIVWEGSEAEGWTETRPVISTELYSHPRGFAVQAALEAFTEWHNEYMFDRDEMGYAQQQSDLAVERRVEQWFEEGIRS